jgi:hypothetical protein
MSTPESKPVEPIAPTPPPDVPGPARPNAALAWALALLVGLIGGGVGWAAGEALRPRFQTPDLSFLRSPEGRRLSRGEQAATLERLKQVSYKQEATAAFGVLGAVVGLGLGLAGGLAARSMPRAAIAGLLGLVVAGGGAAGAAWGIIPPYYEMVSAHDPSDSKDLQRAEMAGNTNDMIYPLIMRGAIFGALGVGAGLAFGLGVGGARRLGQGVLGGLLGGLLAAVVVEFVGSALGSLIADTLGSDMFVVASPPFPIPEHLGSRGLTHLVAGLFVALGAAFGALALQLTAAPRPKPAPAPAAEA